MLYWTGLYIVVYINIVSVAVEFDGLHKIHFHVKSIAITVQWFRTRDVSLYHFSKTLNVFNFKVSFVSFSYL